MTDQVNLVVATPCFGGQVSSIYASSIFALQRALRGMSNVGLTVHLRDGDALITRARANLVTLFLDQISRMHNLQRLTIGDDAVAVLQAQEWPGNARQLRNSVERLLILVKDQAPENGVIGAALLPSDIGEVLPTVGDTDASAHLMSLPLREAREVFERQYLVAQIERFGGNISKTAEFVGMERSALHRKIKSLGL